MRTRSRFPDILVLTCEHAGNRIPAAYADRFHGAEDVLATHRGWDPGTLTLARFLSRQLDRPLHAVRWSRLFVEANRAPHNPRIWSRFMKDLPRKERATILERWWWPHRTEVEQVVTDAIGSGYRVVHVAVHSFTSELDSQVRNAEVAFLYDSRRRQESDFCHRWAGVLHGLNRELRVRYNYPYRGSSDGLTTWLRRRHPEGRYLGIELEINQALVEARGWPQFQKDLAVSLGEVVQGR